MKKTFFLILFFTFLLALLSGTGVFAGDLRIITDGRLPDGTFGVEYNQQLQARGGTLPYTWGLMDGKLPPGLMIHPTFGRIIGTPTEDGVVKTHTFRVSVVDGRGTIANSRRLSIFISIPQLMITNLPPDGRFPEKGFVGKNFEFTFQAEGGIPPYTWKNIPGEDVTCWNPFANIGLQLSEDGKLTGILSRIASPHCSRIKVTGRIKEDALTNIARTNIRIDVEHIPLIITTKTLPSGEVGREYRATLSAVGGRELPYSWRLVGDLPDGLSLTTDGIISGRPTKEGTFDFTIVCRDARKEETTKPFSIKIKPPAPGDPAPGDPALGDPATGDPAPGDPAPGIPGLITFPNPLGARTFEELINALVNFVFWVTIVLAPLMIIISGFYFVTALGDPKKIETGKNIIVWTVVAVIVVLLARGLIALLRGILGAP
ncbi:MAG: Ig domain-containing protein [Candidatus Nealsonbacteria bacterium]|nr:Ig domain-containing protein [Candidatus Nealsonbacteria bacterium]